MAASISLALCSLLIAPAYCPVRRLPPAYNLPLTMLPDLTASPDYGMPTGGVISPLERKNPAAELVAFLRSIPTKPAMGWTNAIATMMGVSRQSVSGWVARGNFNLDNHARLVRLHEVIARISERRSLAEFLTEETILGSPLKLLADRKDEVVLGLSYQMLPMTPEKVGTLQQDFPFALRPFEELREAETFVDAYVPEQLTPYDSEIEPQMVGVASGPLTTG